MAVAAVNGINLYYEIHGRGHPLLLIPGLASDSRSWGRTLSAFAEQFSVITIDNRGSGRTTPLTLPLTIADMALDIAALLRYLGFSSAHILGHSMGGFIAQEFALTFPACVDKLILAATLSECSKRNLSVFSALAEILESDRRRFLRKIFSVIFSESFMKNDLLVADLLEAAVDDPCPQSADAFRAQVDALVRFNRTADVHAVEARTLILAAVHDSICSMEESRAFAEKIPGAIAGTIDSGHSIHIEQPDVFVAEVLSFLEG